jgi:hypothetical protein
MLRYLTIFLPLSTLLAEEPDPAIHELRETISKVIDVQSLESKEKLDWEARKKEISALLELHQRELSLISEELEKDGSSAPSHEEETTKLESQISELKEIRKLTSEAVARNVPRTLSLTKRFPSPLIKEIEPELAALNDWKPSDEPRDALRSILAILAKAEQFNRRFTRTTEVIDNREVHILYLGLAQAFYTDRKEKSGIGLPGQDSWSWESDPEIRSALVTAFETIDKKRPPTMVTLPLQIK